MRTFPLLAVGAILGVSSTLTFGQAPAPAAAASGVSAGDWASIRAAYEAGRHAVAEIDSGLCAHNPGQRWTAHFDGRGFTVEPDAHDWSWGLELESWGFPRQERSVPAAAEMRAEGQRVAYDWDADLTEWFVNDGRGLEHGYTVHRRPIQAGEAGEPGEPLTFALAVRGDLSAEVTSDGRGVRFVDTPGAAVVNYAGLLVFDADGREFAAAFTSTSDGLLLTVEQAGARYPLTIDPIAQQAYLKASNTDAGDGFGHSVAIAGDTIAVGAPGESSSASGVDGDQGDDGLAGSGAVYVFVRNGVQWTQQAYLKPHDPAAGAAFGHAVTLSGDTLVSGAPNAPEDPVFNLNYVGAGYVFVRNGTTWSQQARLKPPFPSPDLGKWVAISGDTAVLGASNTTMVFVRNGSAWSLQASLQAVAAVGGESGAISDNILVVGYPTDSSNAIGVNGMQTGTASFSGAAIVFVRNGTSWGQLAKLKASNTSPGDRFGTSVSLSGNTVVGGTPENTIVVGSPLEDSDTNVVNGSPFNDDAPDSGAAYVYVRNGATWSFEAYLKASNSGSNDLFGSSVLVSGDRIAIGAAEEDSSGDGLTGGQDDMTPSSGAAYFFVRAGNAWAEQGIVKASNTGAGDRFGTSLASSDRTVVISAPDEDSAATGVGGDQDNDLASDSGAAYVLEIDGPLIGTYCTPKTNSQGCAPAMGWSGSPSVSSASPFLLTCSQVINQKSGLLFHGTAGAAIPFQGATLCVLPPIKRTPLQNSMGNALPPEDCSGSYAFDLNALIQSGVDPSLVAGQPVHAQYWARDPGDLAFGTSFSNAVLLVISP